MQNAKTIQKDLTKYFVTFLSPQNQKAFLHFEFCIFNYLSVENFLKVDIAVTSHSGRLTEQRQGIEGCLDHIVRISRAKTLAKHVCDTCAFQYGTH